MQALPVVEDFQILEDAGARLLRGLEVVALDAFGFERAKETLHQRVIIGFPFPTHAHADPPVLQACSVARRGVLAAAIPMMHQPGPRPSPTATHLASRLDQPLVARAI